jgi:TPR repeat protein
MPVDLSEENNMLKNKSSAANAKVYKYAVSLLKDSKTKRKGIALLKKLAQSGHEKANLELALENAAGEELISENAMVKWLKHFHELGDSRATLNLGYCFDQALGVKKNKRKAFELYKKAAMSGLRDAQWNLALLFEKGIGCKQDIKEALKWYKKAAQKGDAESINTLGYYYKYGLGVRKNYVKAFDLFKKAAKKGSSSAYSNIGSMYLSGFGVKKSVRKAEKYLRQGAALGSELGQKLLSELEEEK